VKRTTKFHGKVKIAKFLPFVCREVVKKFDPPTKSAFPVVQGLGKFAPPKPAGQE